MRRLQGPSDSNLHHSEFAAQRLKDAIADHFVEKRGRRPSVDRREADLWLNLGMDYVFRYGSSKNYGV